MSRELDVAMSYLADIDKVIQQIQSNSNNIMAEDIAIKTINGDLKLALREIDQAACSGDDVSGVCAKAFFSKGLIAHAIYVKTNRKFEKGRYDKWAKKAIEAFSESIRHSPSAEAYYNLGASYADIDKKSDAIDAFRMVEQYGDNKLSIEATKMIGRLEEQKSGGCYVATACYGNYDHPDVLVLRQFRDESLMPSVLGRLFVSTYYRLSPPLADRLGSVEWLSSTIRRYFLEPLVRQIRG